jgi:hypothetical protein
MPGSVSESDDALREAWLRIRDLDPGAVDNRQASLTLVVGRVRLNMLRTHAARREKLSVHFPDPVVSSVTSLGRDASSIRPSPPRATATSMPSWRCSPWEVVTPTTLIYLQAAPDLNPPPEEPASGRLSAAFGRARRSTRAAGRRSPGAAASET